MNNAQEVFASGFNPIKYAKDKFNKTSSKIFTTKV